MELVSVGWDNAEVDIGVNRREDNVSLDKRAGILEACSLDWVDRKTAFDPGNGSLQCIKTGQLFYIARLFWQYKGAAAGKIWLPGNGYPGCGGGI